MEPRRETGIETVEVVGIGSEAFAERGPSEAVIVRTDERNVVHRGHLLGSPRGLHKDGDKRTCGARDEFLFGDTRVGKRSRRDIWNACR
ncbi:MAG: hypothetical protein EBU67_02875 [Actinobacteria bacterium]|nr:hypothetical protein [Actinomycetota bacterium]